MALRVVFLKPFRFLIKLYAKFYCFRAIGSGARCWAIVIPLNVGLSARLAPRAGLPKRADFSFFAG